MPDIFFDDEDQQPSDIMAETIEHLEREEERQAEDEAIVKEWHRDGGVSDNE